MSFKRKSGDCSTDECNNRPTFWGQISLHEESTLMKFSSMQKKFQKNKDHY